MPAAAKGNEVSLYLVAGDAGDGNVNDYVEWRQPRFVIPGRADLPLRDVRDFVGQIALRRKRLFGSAAQCLSAAAEVMDKSDKIDVADLAKRHGVESEDLAAWLDYLGIGSSSTPKLAHLDYFIKKMTRSGAYDFVKGWGSSETPLLVANSSDKHVRIPGNMKAHGVCVHPSPTLNACVGWRSPIAGEIRIEGKITHAHPECGNGIEWFLELRRGAIRRRLASGTAQGSKGVALGPIEKLAVRKGDLISILVGPRNGNHACDLTDIEFVLKTSGDNAKEWSLTKDVSPNVLAANPHADRFGNKDVWHFYREPVKGGATGQVIPAGSALSRWLLAKETDKPKLAADVQKLLIAGPPADPKNPDTVLYRQLASLGGPLFKNVHNVGVRSANAYGVDPAMFGNEPTTLRVQAPSVVEIHLPADLFAGAELVATGALDATKGHEGSVQLQATAAKPASGSALRSDLPIVVADGSDARKRWDHAFEEFRRLFPAALCYTKIVPVDEVITLTLFHREDENLCRLMLDDKQIARLNRLWLELHFISRDALTTVDAYKQLLEYATQDADPRVFYPLRKPINDRAAAYKKALLAAEPRQLDAVIQFANRAYRRPLTDMETQELRGLYAKLRKLELPHEDALRLTLARVFVSPAFLYRLEKAPPGKKPGPVTDYELATRLSYFLTSSTPDQELLAAAAAGKLHTPDVLVAQTKRLLKDARIRRLATEFACHWLHIDGFDTLDEKSERHFPEFAKLRGDMYEESIRFFTDFFQSDGIDLEHPRRGSHVRERIAGQVLRHPRRDRPRVAAGRWRAQIWPRRHSRPFIDTRQAIGGITHEPDPARRVDFGNAPRRQAAEAAQGRAEAARRRSRHRQNGPATGRKAFERPPLCRLPHAD